MAANRGSSDAEKAEIFMVDDTMAGSNALEKAPTVRVIDDFHVLGLTEEDADFYNNYTPEMRKKTMRKVSPLAVKY